MKKIAVYPGSFDPFHNGHRKVIEIASQLFDEIRILVTFNLDKLSSQVIMPYENMQLISSIYKNDPKVKVSQIDDEFVADFAKENNISYLIRSVKRTTDFEKEKNLSAINSNINPDLNIMYIRIPEPFSEISGKNIRDFVRVSGWETKVKKDVPVEIYEYFLIKYQGYKHEFKNTVKIILEHYGIEPDSNNICKLYSNIRSAYVSNIRKYHDFLHPIKGIDYINSLDLNISEFERAVIKYVYWMHDYVYSPGVRENEKYSADYAAQALRGLGIHDEELLARIHDLIMLTDLSERDTYDVARCVINDTDLITIGQSDYFEFSKTTSQIREEYSIYSDERWLKGRIKFINKMLARKSVYKMSTNWQVYEKTAIDNLLKQKLECEDALELLINTKQ